MYFMSFAPISVICVTYSALIASVHWQRLYFELSCLSRSRPVVLYIPARNIFSEISRPCPFRRPRTEIWGGGEKITTQEMIVDVSQEWVLVNDVQQRVYAKRRVYSEIFSFGSDAGGWHQ